MLSNASETSDYFTLLIFPSSSPFRSVNLEIRDFKAPHYDWPRLGGVVFCSLSKEDIVGLTAPCLYCEINWVVSLSEGNSSLDPGGFNHSFFKRLWPLLRDDIRVMFD